jgi:hypothetical protein
MKREINKTKKVLWIIIRTLVLIGLAYPFALLIAGYQPNWEWGYLAHYIFGISWVISIVPVSFLISPIIRSFRQKKIIKATIICLLCCLLLYPFGYCIFLLTLSFPIEYFSYTNFSGMKPKGFGFGFDDISCNLQEYPKKYSIQLSRKEDYLIQINKDPESSPSTKMTIVDPQGAIIIKPIDVTKYLRWGINKNGRILELPIEFSNEYYNFHPGQTYSFDVWWHCP